MMRHDLVPDELDERLHEWARYFKDRHQFSRCKSIEGRFNPHAPGAWDTGWGDPGAPTAILPSIQVRRALQTHEAIQELPKPSKWAITLSYCYPSLERWRVLKIMRKYTGRRFSWSGHSGFLDVLEIARVKVWARIRTQPIDMTGTNSAVCSRS